MKRLLNSFFLLLIVLAFTSCENPDQMMTIVNPDGSCVKTFQFDADSAFMAGQPAAVERYAPVQLDSSWEISWKTDFSEKSTRYPISNALYDSICSKIPAQTDSVTGVSERKKPVFHIEIRKKFASAEDLQASFRLKSSNPWSELRVRYAFERKFRWFYTYYTYRETYPALKTGFTVPATRFMTQQEAGYWFTGIPDLTTGLNGVETRELTGDLEDKYNEWFSYNLWKNEFSEMLKHFSQVENVPVSAGKLALLCDSIYRKSEHKAFETNLENTLNRFFKTNAFSILWNGEDSPMQNYRKQFENKGFIRFFYKSTDSRIQMPGTARNTPGAALNDGVLYWKLTGFRLITGDYTLEAHSRKANTWAFVLTGVLALLALGSFFYRPGRKKVG